MLPLAHGPYPGVDRQTLGSSSVGRWLVRLWAVVAAGVALYQTGRLLSYGSDIWTLTRGEYVGRLAPDSVLGRQFAPLPVTDLVTGMRDTLDLSGGWGLVLVYDVSCVPCGLNMPNWLDLVASIDPRKKVRVIAVSLHESVDVPAEDTAQLAARDVTNQHRYWSGLEGHVRIVVPTRDSILKGRGLYPGTPTTIVTRDSRIVAFFFGALTRWKESWIRRALRS